MTSIFEEIDHFDLLPDPILLSIFNKVNDAKSLCSSMSVCKRFNSIIPEIDNVFLSIPPKKSHKDRNNNNSSFKNLFRRVFMKPLNFLLQFLKSKSCHCESEYGLNYHIPHEILKPFKDLKSIEINLPKSSGDLGCDLLKWKAEFGSQLQTCVLIGAKSISRNKSERQIRNQDSRISDEELKLRIVWTISCLIAASARHYLIQQTLKDGKKLEKLSIRDESNQGIVSMNSDQIEELRKSMMNSLGVKKEEEMVLLDRTKVPALRMKMWYAPELKLQESDSVMKGATLVVIKPVEEGMKKAEESEDWVVEAFDGDEGNVFVEAVRNLMKKKRSYTLEMNSF